MLELINQAGRRRGLWIIVAAGLGFGGGESGLLPAPCAAQENEPVKYAEELADAARELSFFNFDVAYQRFTDLLGEADSQDGEAWEKVVFGLALAAQNRTPSSPALIAEAQQRYEQLLAETPQSKLAPRAMLNLGRIAEVRDFAGDAIDLPAARAYYETVAATWPQLDVADEAVLRLGSSLMQDFDDPAKVRQGAELIENWVAGREDRPLASALYEAAGMGRLIFLNDLPGGVRALDQAVRLGLIDESTAGRVYWIIASVAEHDLGEVDLAVRYYQRIITDAARSGRAFEAEMALQRLAAAYPQRNITIPQSLTFQEPDSQPSPTPDDAGVPRTGPGGVTELGAVGPGELAPEAVNLPDPVETQP